MLFSVGRRSRIQRSIEITNVSVHRADSETGAADNLGDLLYGRGCQLVRHMITHPGRAPRSISVKPSPAMTSSA
jgi:hypothetical protein